MRLAFSIFIFVESITSVFAQEKPIHSVEVKPEFRAQERSIPIDVVAVEDDGYYMHYSRGKYGQGSDFLIRFDNDLQPTNDITEFSSSGTNIDTISTVGFIQGNSSLLHISVSRTPNSRKYFKRVFDLDTKQLGLPELMAEVKSDERSVSKAFETLIFSKDTAQIAFIYTVPNRNRDYQKLKVFRMDANFSTLSEEEYEFPYSNKSFAFQKINLGSQGQIDILAKVYNSERILYGEKNKGYQYLVYQIRDGVHEKAIIQFPRLHVKGLNMNISKTGEYYLTGLYSIDDFYGVRGCVFAKLGVNGEIESRKLIPLEHEYFTQLVEPGKKRERIIKKLANGTFEEGKQVFDGTVYIEDRNLFILIVERKWIVSSNYTTTYNTLEIGLIAINTNGDIEWARKIGKNNSKTNAFIYSSFGLVKRERSLMFFYGDHIQNQNHKYGRMPNAFSMNGVNYCFAAASVDWSGNVTKNIAVNVEDIGRTRIRPGLSRWIDDNSILFFGQDISNLKNQRFIKINFHED